MPLGKLSDLLFNFTLRSLPPPPPPIPLPPPPSCALVPYGPYLVSRTEDFAAPSARFHSASAPSGDILAPLRSSFVIGIIVFIIGLLGLGCGCYLVFDRASRGVFSNPRTKPTRKPGTTSLLLARSSAALRTLIHVAAMSCCLYGVIQFMQCIVFGVCLTSNTEAATVLVDLEPQIMVDNLRQFFGTVKDFIYSVDHERFRDRDFVDRISLASVTVVTERLASLLHGVRLCTTSKEIVYSMVDYLQAKLQYGTTRSPIRFDPRPWPRIHMRYFGSSHFFYRLLCRHPRCPQLSVEWSILIFIIHSLSVVSVVTFKNPI